MNRNVIIEGILENIGEIKVERGNSSIGEFKNIRYRVTEVMRENRYHSS